jgi:hypothetical protein
MQMRELVTYLTETAVGERYKLKIFCRADENDLPADWMYIDK